MDPLTIGLVIAGGTLFVMIVAFGCHWLFRRERADSLSESRPLLSHEVNKPTLRDFLDGKRQEFKKDCATVVSKALNNEITQEICGQQLRGFYRRILLIIAPDKIQPRLDSGEYEGNISEANEMASWAKKYASAAEGALKEHSLHENTTEELMGYIEKNIEELEVLNSSKAKEKWEVEKLKERINELSTSQEKLDDRIASMIQQKFEEKLAEVPEEAEEKKIEQRKRGATQKSETLHTTKPIENREVSVDLSESEEEGGKPKSGTTPGS